MSSVDVARKYVTAMKAQDQTRPVAANMNVQSSPGLAYALEVQGVSHSSVPDGPTKAYCQWNYSFAGYHQKFPDRPLVSSESSSCNTQRGEMNISLADGIFDTAFNAPCLSAWPCSDWRKNGTMPSDEAQFWGGSCVQSWTLPYNMTSGQIFDYVVGTLGMCP